MAIVPSNPIVSPSLNEIGPAILIDENSNKIPCVAVIDVDSSGHTGLTADLIEDGKVSQVTNRRQPPQAKASSVPKVPVIALCSLNKTTGALIPWKPATALLANTATLAATATLAVAATTLNGKFASTEQTGTGSEQSIAHGLSTIPGAVLISITDPGLETAGAADGAARAVIVEGTHTTAAVKVTVTSGAKYKVLALK